MTSPGDFVLVAYLGLDLLVTVVDDLSETEVPQLDNLLAVHEEHVVRLDVSMQHLLLLVQVVHTQAQLYFTDRKAQQQQQQQRHGG